MYDLAAGDWCLKLEHGMELEQCANMFQQKINLMTVCISFTMN
jgi:hypothetical protein